MNEMFEIIPGREIAPPAQMFLVSEDGWASIETSSGVEKDLEVVRGFWYPIYVIKIIKMKKKLSWGNIFKKQKVLGCR